MRTQLGIVISILFAGAASTTACSGNLDGHTGTPTALATLHGQLSNPDDLGLGSDVRVAVVWQATAPAQYEVSEDLPVRPVFPSSFEIALDGPPPSAAVHPDDGVQVAFGVVVAYEDLNGNGKLDLVSDDAGAFIDKIIGADPSLAILYFSGSLPPSLVDSFGKHPAQGYNLAQLGDCPLDAGAPPTLPDGAPASDAGACIGAEWLPIDTPFTLPLSSSPQMNELMCSSGPEGSAGETGSGCGPEDGGPCPLPVWDVATQGTPYSGYPAADNPGLVCTSATSYTFKGCTTFQTSLCSTTNYCDDTGEIVELGGAAPPPGWPCSQ